jgi:NADPH:quinone reductase-like Zn-dependent oxidoreductase
MKAIIVKSHGNTTLADIEEPALQSDFIKVKNVAVAVNPTDVDHVGGVGRVGGIPGCDLSGYVVEIGKDCKSDAKKGDAVYGVCHGANIVSQSLSVPPSEPNKVRVRKATTGRLPSTL